MSSALTFPVAFWSYFPSIQPTCSLSIPEYGFLLLGTDIGQIWKFQYSLEYTNKPVTLINIMTTHSGPVTCLSMAKYSMDSIASEEDVIISIDCNGYLSLFQGNMYVESC